MHSINTNISSAKYGRVSVLKSCPSTFTYILLITLITHTYVSSAALFAIREACNEQTANSECHCSPVLTDFEIHCPALALSPKISVRIRPETHDVEIECNHIDTKEYNVLPHLPIGPTQMVLMKECPLPRQSPIALILDHIGITEVDALLIENNDLGVNLTRQHLRGLQGLTRLRINSNVLSHVPENLFTDLKNLTWLDLRSNVVELPVNIFAALENLDFLELGHNKLKHLPPGIFQNQRKLRLLSLWSNQLRNLTKNVFEGVSSITELDLSSNDIESFQPDVFSLLPNLANISLNANHIRELPKSLFEENKNLTQFLLINNRVPLRTLPPGLLSNLPHLRVVRLTCDLRTLPGDLFANSSALTTIIISNNEIATIPNTLLVDQYNLYHLDLRRNRIRSLPDELLANKPNLTVLILSYNEISEISSNIFSELVNLETLYLDNNHLITINSNAFLRTQNLRYISMENNQVNLSDFYGGFIEGNFKYGLVSPFQYLIKLETLNLRNNSIMTIFRDWKLQLLALKHLDLSFNNITLLHDSDLQYLTRNTLSVNLTHNQLREIDFQNIRVLDLSKNRKVLVDLNNNPLYCDCTLLSFVQYVRGELGERFRNQIVLDTTTLTCEQPHSLNGKNVRDVAPMQLMCPFDNGNSEVKHCPRGCECWVRTYDLVLIVNCSNGNMTRVPDLPRLDQFKLKATELFIENNHLLKLPNNTMPGYAFVTKIYAAGNNLTKIEAINLPRRLSQLDLRRNHLEYLDTSALNFFNESRSLLSLNLSHNPWRCNCASKKLLKFVQSNYRLIGDFEKMQCGDNAHLKFFSDLFIADVCHSNNIIVIILAFIILFVGLSIAITVRRYDLYLTPKKDNRLRDILVLYSDIGDSERLEPEIKILNMKSSLVLE